LLGCFGLAVENGRCGYFIATEVLADSFEAELFGSLGSKERRGRCGEVWMLSGLI
jgi:hypothetical protein